MPLFAEVSDAVQIATMVCALIGTIVVSVGAPLIAAWIARMNRRSEAQAKFLESMGIKTDATALVAEKNATAITEVGKAVDGLTTKLVDATKISSEAMGKEKEQAAQKARESLVAEGEKKGKADQKDLQVKAATGPEITGHVSSVKDEANTGGT